MSPSLSVTIARATIYSISTGNLYKNGSNSPQAADANTYAMTWVSNASNPQVKLYSDANNISTGGRAAATTEGPGALYANGGKTYTISVPNNYKITGYTISGQSYTSDAAAGNDITATTTAGPTQTFKGSEVKTLEVSGKDFRSTSFTLTGSNAFLRPSSFLIFTDEDQTFVANKASLSNAKSYMVHGVRGDWHFASADATSLGKTETFNRTDDTRQIAFIKSDKTGEYYAYSVITEKFIASDNTLSDTPTPIYIFETGNADYPFFFSFMSDKSDKNINISSGIVSFSSYNTYDDGNRWCLYAAKDFDIPSAVSTAIEDFETANVTVTYKLIYNENVIAEREVTQAVGSTAVAPWDEPDFCSFGDCSPATIDEDTEEVEIEMTSSLPFTLSTNYSSATWYYMTIRDTYYVIYDPSSANKTSTSSTTSKSDAVATAERALWAFTGDPLNGIKVMNKAAGDGLYLNSNNTPLRMQVSDSYAIWTLEQNGTGFTLNNAGYYVNDVNRELGFWNNAAASTDEGSTMRIEAVDYYDLTQAYLTQFATANVIANDEYFGVRPADATALSTGYSTAFSANHALVTASLYDNTLKPAIENLIKLPETGYYRMKNVNESGYYLGYDGTADAGSSICLRGMQDNTSAKTIVHFVKDGENNSYQLSLEGTNIAAVSQSVKRTPSATAANFKAEYIAPGIASFSTTLSGYTYLHCSSSQEYAIVGWETGKKSPASKWTIEKVTSQSITLNDGGDDHYYATLYLPFDATISGATAYTMRQSGNWLIPTEVENNKVPAGTPVLLRGTSASATATINTGDAFSSLSGLDANFTGTYTEISTARATGEYILSKVDGVVGFYKRGEGKKILANRAYLQLDEDISEGGEIKGFYLDFDGIATDINGIENVPSSTDAIYNIAGQRVKAAQKGLYIINGKKVLVK